MTIEEKRKELTDFCLAREYCDTSCPLHVPSLKCGRGENFSDSGAGMSDGDVILAYSLLPIQAKSTSIKDSGNRREFTTGAVRDIQEGKGRMDLLPWAAIMEVSKHCENGAKKYGEHNVDKGLPVSSFCDSAARHLAKYIDGWDDEPHLLAAAWNLLWAIQMELKHPELCDVPWKGEQK
jgi:hypothetical protein